MCLKEIPFNSFLTNKMSKQISIKILDVFKHIPGKSVRAGYLESAAGCHFPQDLIIIAHRKFEESQ